MFILNAVPTGTTTTVKVKAASTAKSQQLFTTRHCIAPEDFNLH